MNKLKKAAEQTRFSTRMERDHLKHQFKQADNGATDKAFLPQ